MGRNSKVTESRMEEYQKLKTVNIERTEACSGNISWDEILFFKEDSLVENLFKRVEYCVKKRVLGELRWKV